MNIQPIHSPGKWYFFDFYAHSPWDFPLQETYIAVQSTGALFTMSQETTSVKADRCARNGHPPPSAQASIGLLMPGNGPVQYLEEEEESPEEKPLVRRSHNSTGQKRKLNLSADKKQEKSFVNSNDSTRNDPI